MAGKHLYSICDECNEEKESNELVPILVEKLRSDGISVTITQMLCETCVPDEKQPSQRDKYAKLIEEEDWSWSGSINKRLQQRHREDWFNQ